MSEARVRRGERIRASAFWMVRGQLSVVSGPLVCLVLFSGSFLIRLNKNGSTKNTKHTNN